MATSKRARRLPLVWTCACVLAVPAGVSGQTVSGPAQQETPADSPQVQKPSSSLSDLFKDTVRDFKRLPSLESLALLSIGGVAAAWAHPVDHPVSRSLSAPQWLGDVFEPGKTIGGARVQLASAVAVYATGRVTRSPRVTVVGADLIRAQVMAQALTAAIKVSVQRDRPDGTEYSFPSGHTSVTFASATVLQRHFGLKVGIPAYGVATFVAASRINEKRHFLSDVAFGAAIGLLSGRTVTIGSGNKRFDVAPVAAPDGIGVSLYGIGSRQKQ